MIHSQNNEATLLLDYFKDETDLNLLEIGAYDGVELSNSLDLILTGRWKATLVEPHPVHFMKLLQLHGSNPNITLINGAVSGSAQFRKMMLNSYWASTISDNPIYQDGSHEFAYNYLLQAISIYNLVAHQKPFHFISIDTEGEDMSIADGLMEMKMTKQPAWNLESLRAMCIEWGSRDETYWIKLLTGMGMNTFHKNGENILAFK